MTGLPDTFFFSAFWISNVFMSIVYIQQVQGSQTSSSKGHSISQIIGPVGITIGVVAVALVVGTILIGTGGMALCFKYFKEWVSEKVKLDVRVGQHLLSNPSVASVSSSGQTISQTTGLATTVERRVQNVMSKRVFMAYSLGDKRVSRCLFI